MTHYISSYLWSANFTHDQIDINSHMVKAHWLATIDHFVPGIYVIGYEKRAHFTHFKVFAFVIVCKRMLAALHFAVYLASLTSSVAELRVCKVEQYAESDSEITKRKH